MRKNIPSMKELRVRLASAVDACRRREWPDTYDSSIDDMGIKRAVEELASAYSAAALARRRELQKAA